MTKHCPKCSLLNPPDAQWCDCGYDFISRSVPGAVVLQQRHRRARRRVGYALLALGGLLLLTGLAVYVRTGEGRAERSGLDALILVPFGVLAVLSGCVGLVRLLADRDQL
ncbi:MAG: hypothetical protein K2X82_21780 [Gemmataceae bacterium]|nr:hypothetical protein [Gemmataceae bacterium]